MKIPESDKVYEAPAWRVRRIAEIQAELFSLREIVASNAHLITPDGEDLGEYADNVTATISELEAELNELLSSTVTSEPNEIELPAYENTLLELSREELQELIKDLRARVRFLNIQSDDEARVVQLELDAAEQTLKQSRQPSY